MMKRFWDKVDKTDECWVWTAGKNSHGYGAFKIDNKTVGAHVISYTLTNGNIPKGIEVCHTCDNPPCVRPDHLWLGTRKENAQDSAHKGRNSHGERHHTSKLSDSQVQQILKDNRSVNEIANDYKVTIQAIWYHKKKTSTGAKL